MTTFQPRPYQDQGIHDLRSALADVDSAIYYLPTGGGKTRIACDITDKAVQRGSHVLFMGDSSEIIEQTSATMRDAGISHGIIQASRKSEARMWEKVHIATIQTLRNRKLPKKDLVFIDECHLSRAESWHTVIAAYRDMGAKVIGLTATPCRLDGKGLGKLFDTIVYGPSIQALMDEKYLVELDPIYSFPTADTSKVSSKGGDFDKKELAEAMGALVGDPVEHYKRYTMGRPAILAAVTIEHSKELCEAFNAAGIPAAHCDGNTPYEERKRILGDKIRGTPSMLQRGEILVLCQVDVCGKGFDDPCIEVAIDCRPTQSLARWLQFVGRVLRPYPGKVGAALLDHAGNMKFGHPADEREWSLDEASGVKKADADKTPAVTLCSACYRCHRTGPDHCPHCGHLLPRRAREIPKAVGELVKVEKKLRTADEWRALHKTEDERHAKYIDLAKTASIKVYKPGWLGMTYNRLYGVWPKKEWRMEAMELGLIARPVEVVEDGQESMAL